MEVEKRYFLYLIISLIVVILVPLIAPNITLVLIPILFILMRYAREKYVRIDERDEFIMSRSCKAALFVSALSLSLIVSRPEVKELPPLALVATLGTYYGSLIYYYRKYG